MPQGFEVYAEDGSLQLSADLICWFCRVCATGSVVSNNNPRIGNTGPARLAVPISGYTYPLVAVSVPGYTTARGQNTTGQYNFITDAPIGTTFTYWIFDYAPILPASNIGIEAYNASGQRTFSSEYFPLKAIGDLRTTSSITRSGKTLAIMNPTMIGYREAGPIDYYEGGNPVVPGSPYDQTGYQNHSKLGGGYITSGGQTAISNDVSYDDVYVGPVWGDVYVPPDWTVDGPVLVVDVTSIPTGTFF